MKRRKPKTVAMLTMKVTDIPVSTGVARRHGRRVVAWVDLGGRCRNFSGEVLEFKPFWVVFTATIDSQSFSKMEKLEYLKGVLRGQPLGQ